MVDIYQVQLRNGTAAQVDTFTGASGELTYDTDTGQVRIHDGSTVGGFKLVRIDSSGNVGIGTSSPGSILEVASASATLTLNDTDGTKGGAINSRVLFEASGVDSGSVGYATGGGAMVLQSKGGNLYLQADEDNSAESSYMYFFVDGTEAARIDSSGNIHIGANALYPGQLTIVGINGEVAAGNTTDSLATFSDNGAASISIHSGSANTGTIYFGRPGAGGNTKGRLQYNHSSDAIIVYTDNTERLRIDSAGNVLIGTSTSDKQLTLYSATDASQGISLRNQSAGTSAASYISMGNDSDALDGQIFLTGSMNTSYAGTRSFNFLSNVGAFGFYRNRLSPVATMVMDTSGNLLVNTTTDHNGKVSIKSTGTEQHLVFEQENVSTDGWGIRSYGAGGGNLEISRMTGNTTFTTLMSLLTNGNVNIVNDLYIGSSSGQVLGTDMWSPSLQVNDTQGIAAIRASNDAFGGALNLSSARGSYGSPTIVLNGDRLGGVYFSGYDGGDYQSYGAAIEAYVNGTPGVNDMPGSLRFYTVADGSNTLSERMRIDSAGSVGIGATGNYTLTVGPQGGSGHSIVQLVNATTGTTAANGAYISVLGSQSDMRVWQLGNANIIIGTNAAERMRISANGHIGIGGTPAEKFDVIAPDNSSIIMARVTRSSKDYGIALENNGGTGHSTINAFGSGAALIFETNGTERARITSGGTLAVGTTAGLNSELIHARRSSGTISTLYNSGATGDVLRLYHENTAVTAFSIWGGGAQRGFITSPASSNGLILGYSGTEAARIDFNGNIGIGVTPGCRLHVYAADTSTMTLLRGDTHGTRFGFSASESLIDSVTAAVSDYAPLQINAKTSLTLRLNSATVVALATSGMTVTGTAVATQGMPIITELTTARTLALSDIGAYIKTGNAAATTITVPPNSTVSWPQGAEIVIIQSNTGTVTIAPGAGVTLNSLDSLTDLAGRNAVVTLKRVGTDSWDLFGALA
jgi:hypothetical protein